MLVETDALGEYLDSIPVGHRRPRFQALASAMLSAGRPIWILETGCMRQSQVDGPEADGCSTLVWNYVAEQTKGKLVTVDVDPKNVEYTKTKVSSRYTDVIHCDSVYFLTNLREIAQPFDLAYLDSMDFEGTEIQRALSSLHHVAELAAAWSWLANGALIAVDDCMGAYAGKHGMVKRFFDSINVAPLCDDYIHVWRKPELREPISI